MNETGKNIINLLADKLSLQNKNKEELLTIANRYPYFGFIQFLLTKKIKEENDADAAKQMQRCALYFSNPFWLHYLLNENAAAINESLNSQPALIVKQDEEFYATTTAPVTGHPTEPIVSSEETEQKTYNTNTASIMEPVAETLFPDKETQEKNANSTATDAESQGNVVEKTQENIINAAAEEPVIETENENIYDDPERQKLSKLIEQHLSEFRKPVGKDQDVPISTRVYHAIDYFASQGIKLDPASVSEDKLESKVKKFTDWLKQMKRANENPTDLGTDIETEHLIEKIAQTSNEAKDVITETMAEVLIKQGKNEKAIQLYQKLSFLNPSKTTYFAAKINELKGSK